MSDWRRWGVVAEILSLCLAVGPAASADSPQPWRLGRALSAPEWLSLDGSYRVRYETLNHPYRAGFSGSDEILVERLLVNARVDVGHFVADVELEDSRQQLADSGTPLGTDIVNTLEPLRVFVRMRFTNAFSAHDRLDVELGRVTIDNGSRRLVARNRFRNTINAFSGLHALWYGAGGSEVQAFFVQPVQRKVSDFQSLKDNHAKLDTDSGDMRLWGVFLSRPHLFGNVTGEAYFYRFRSRDHVHIPVADRDLYAPGVRLLVTPAAGAWDFEAEGVYQWGASRASTDTRDLQHEAGFFHGEIGYTLQTGQCGSFVGNQVEARIQYNALSGNLALEFGGAWLIHGEFLENAPNAPREGDTTYLYAAATLTL